MSMPDIKAAVREQYGEAALRVTSGRASCCGSTAGADANPWFDASTSFVNPAVTGARSATDRFSGIRPADAPVFIAAQLVGAGIATMLFRWLVPALPATAPDVSRASWKLEAIAQR